MSVRRASLAAAAALALASPTAMAATGQPLRHRAGVVVAWEAGSRSNIVAVRTGRVYVINSLRRYTPGTRVRIRGIKWGRTVRGIKWGSNPLGIKWGIRIAQNGVYRSGLTVLGRQRAMALRGVVLRRWRWRVAISVRGAVFFLPIARRAVWLPSGKVIKAGTIGAAGSRNVFRIAVGPGGRPRLVAARQTVAARPTAPVPFAGIVTALDPATGTVVVRATRDRRYPIVLTLTVPESVNLAGYAVRDHVSGIMRGSPVGPERFVTLISRDNTFAQADDPATTQVAAPPDFTALADANALKREWEAAHERGRFTPAGADLFAAGRDQLRQIERAIMRGSRPAVIADLLRRFAALVRGAVPTGGAAGGPPAQIDPAVRTAILDRVLALVADLPPGDGSSGGGPPGGGGSSGSGDDDDDDDDDDHHGDGSQDRDRDHEHDD